MFEIKNIEKSKSNCKKLILLMLFIIIISLIIAWIPFTKYWHLISEDLIIIIWILYCTIVPIWIGIIKYRWYIDKKCLKKIIIIWITPIILILLGVWWCFLVFYINPLTIDMNPRP